MPMNLLMRDVRGHPPEQDDLAMWALELDLAFPVLADDGASVGRVYDTYAGPKLGVLIDRGMVIADLGYDVPTYLDEAVALVQE